MAKLLKKVKDGLWWNLNRQLDHIAETNDFKVRDASLKQAVGANSLLCQLSGLSKETLNVFWRIDAEEYPKLTQLIIDGFVSACSLGVVELDWLMPFDYRLDWYLEALEQASNRTIKVTQTEVILGGYFGGYRFELNCQYFNQYDHSALLTDIKLAAVSEGVDL